MPLYEYECRKCKHRFEKIQKFSDRPEKKCPQCGGPLEKVISAAAVQFKGTGWYVTDYAKKSGTSGGVSKSEGHSEKSETKSETKPKAESSQKTESAQKKSEPKK
jgi:putative FmdB family regulatory protein